MKQVFKFNITIEDIRELKPCYDLVTKLGENWQGNLINILEHNDLSTKDKIWVVTRFLGVESARLFSVLVASEALSKIKTESPQWIKQINNIIHVSELFARGKATDKERYAARSAACYVVYSAADSAAEYAARSVAYSVADYAAYSAAEYAAEYAARSAADSVADSAVYSAVYSAARSNQVAQLVKIVNSLIQHSAQALTANDRVSL